MVASFSSWARFSPTARFTSVLQMLTISSAGSFVIMPGSGISLNVSRAAFPSQLLNTSVNSGLYVSIHLWTLFLTVHDFTSHSSRRLLAFLSSAKRPCGMYGIWYLPSFTSIAMVLGSLRSLLLGELSSNSFAFFTWYGFSCTTIYPCVRISWANVYQ